MQSGGTAIPVVMYHTVGRPIPDWKWSFLTVPFKIFEDHLKWLAKNKYTTVGLDELQAHVTETKLLPARSVVLTFDDGYLDNWTYVAPLLSRFGFKGTVFINPEFVDPRDIVRPHLDDFLKGRCKETELEVRGFMSWPELKQLADNGPLIIQSHAMSHTWYPTSSKIVDFHHPGDEFFWLDWNAHPETKPFYLRNPEKSAIPYGTPVYEHDKSLKIRAFFPDPSEGEQLVDFVVKKGGEQFFTSSNWREHLFHKVDEIRSHGSSQGRLETEAEQRERYAFELTRAKQILEKKLNIQTNFFCWPGGGYNDLSQKMALDIYTAVTLGSADKTPITNTPGDDASLIRRIGVPGIEYKGKITYPGGRHFIRFLDEYRGIRSARRRRQALKCLHLIIAAMKNIIS